MSELDALLPGFDYTIREVYARMDMPGRIKRAIELLKVHEPIDGYYVAFSGGKDSIVIKELVRMAVVKHECFYNQTTIDPPELVRFIKEHHPDVPWNIPKHGNMMHRVATRPSQPPTRIARWCCDEYKERGGEGRVKVFGVRADESRNRAIKWNLVSLDKNGRDKVVCPIVYWTDEQVWEFIRAHNLPYCKLYDEGWTRLGCVGCPLNNKSRIKEFARWPAFERNWKKAIIANWQNWKDVPRKDGKPRFQANFKSGEDLWDWWMQEQTADPFREDCQTMLLMTNQELDELEDAE